MNAVIEGRKEFREIQLQLMRMVYNCLLGVKEEKDYETFNGI